MLSVAVTQRRHGAQETAFVTCRTFSEYYIFTIVFPLYFSLNRKRFKNAICILGSLHIAEY